MNRPVASPQTPDFGLLPGLVGYHLRRAQVRVFGDFAKTMSDYQITPGQFGVMVLVGHNPGLSQSALARAVGVERSTMVAVIDGLERRRLIERRPSPQDRRSYAIVLTDPGTALLAELERTVLEHDERVSGHLTDAEKKTLIRLLDRLGEGR